MPKYDVDLLLGAVRTPRRRRMIEALAVQPRSVTELADLTGVSLPAVMEHLQAMQDAGLVRTTKVGRVRVCALEEAAFLALSDWVTTIRRSWEQRLDRLEEMYAPDEKEEGPA